MGDGSTATLGKIQPHTLAPEKRKHAREEKIALKAVVDRDGKEFLGYIKNLSRGGMFIATPNPKKEGEVFTVTFRLPGVETIEIRCRCRVVWQRGLDTKKGYVPGMGVEFVEQDRGLLDRIEYWISCGNCA